MAAPSRPRRVNPGCIRAICVLLAASALIFAALAGMKPRREALPAQEPQDPGPLASIFVCITFAWQVDKLGLLQLVRVQRPAGSVPCCAWRWFPQAHSGTLRIATWTRRPMRFSPCCASVQHQPLPLSNSPVT